MQSLNKFLKYIGWKTQHRGRWDFTEISIDFMVVSVLLFATYLPSA